MKALVDREPFLYKFRSGVSLKDLKIEYPHVGRATIYGWIVRAGLNYPRAHVKGIKIHKEPKYKIKLTKEIKLKILSEFNEGARLPLLCKKYGQHQSSVYTWMKREGLKTRKDKKESGRVADTISLLNDGLPVRQIMAKLGVTQSSIRNVCHIHKIKAAKAILLRRTSIKHDYFEHIDSSKKAYFLGLLFADGCVQKKIDRISISLIGMDRYLLDELRRELETEYKISPYQPKMKNSKPAVNFQFYSEQIKKDLIKLGCTPVKSKTLKFPDIEDEYFWDFFRGYFDGDGHISVKQGKRGGFLNRIGITSSYPFNLKLRHILLEKFNIVSCFSFPKDANCTNLIVVRQGDVSKIYNYMYERDTVFMKRKKEKFKL